MINHIRTLLLNRAALSTVTTPDALEEFIEPGFRPLALSGTVSRMHTAVMPAGLDRLTANAYVFSYLQLMHQPDFQPYLLDLDPRITYSLDGSTLFDSRRRTGVPAVPDYVASLKHMMNASMGGSGSPLLNSGDWTGKDAVAYVWMNNTSGIQRLTAGLYLLVHCIEKERLRG